MVLSPREQQKFQFQGKGRAFLQVARSRWTIPPFDLSFTGNDPRGVLKSTDPRPPTGVFLGPNSIITENTDLTYKPIAQAGSKVPKGWRVENEVTSVEMDLVYSDDPLIKPFFRPPGLRGTGYFGFGGIIDPGWVSLVIIRENFNQVPLIYYEVHYYYAGVLKVSPDITSAREAERIKLVFLPQCGLGEDSCPLPAGQQTMLGFFVSIDPNTQANRIVNPRNPMAIEGEQNFTPFMSMI